MAVALTVTLLVALPALAIHRQAAASNAANQTPRHNVAPGSSVGRGPQNTSVPGESAADEVRSASQAGADRRSNSDDPWYTKPIVVALLIGLIAVGIALNVAISIRHRRLDADLEEDPQPLGRPLEPEPAAPGELAEEAATELRVMPEEAVAPTVAAAVADPQDGGEIDLFAEPATIPPASVPGDRGLRARLTRSKRVADERRRIRIEERERVRAIRREARQEEKARLDQMMQGAEGSAAGVEQPSTAALAGPTGSGTLPEVSLRPLGEPAAAASAPALNLGAIPSPAVDRPTSFLPLQPSEPEPRALTRELPAVAPIAPVVETDLILAEVRRVIAAAEGQYRSELHDLLDQSEMRMRAEADLGNAERADQFRTGTEGLVAEAEARLRAELAATLERATSIAHDSAEAGVVTSCEYTDQAVGAAEQRLRHEVGGMIGSAAIRLRHEAEQLVSESEQRSRTEIEAMQTLVAGRLSDALGELEALLGEIDARLLRTIDEVIEPAAAPDPAAHPAPVAFPAYAYPAPAYPPPPDPYAYPPRHDPYAAQRAAFGRARPGPPPAPAHEQPPRYS